jgi:hypothetical protein
VVVVDPAATAGPSSAATQLARAMFALSLPGAVQQIVSVGQVPRTSPLAGKTAVDGKPTAYACLGPQCSLPVTEPDALVELLRRQRAASPAPPAA